MHYKAAWACGQAALRLAHMPTRRYDHHRLSPLVSTRNDEGPALASLRRIQRHSVSIDNGAPVSGISSINQDQAATMAALKVKKLSNELQLSLL